MNSLNSRRRDLKASVCVIFVAMLVVAANHQLLAQTLPTVTTLPVTNLDSTAGTALARASVNPNGAGTTVYFQYGTNLSYTSASSSSFISVGNTPVVISSPIFPNLPNTLYHVRAVASNSAGTALGSDLTFTMPIVPPAISLMAVTNISSTTATVQILVNPRNSPTQVYLRYGTAGSATGYGFYSTTNSVNGLNAAVLSFPLTGLQPKTTYYFGIFANNGAGAQRLDDFTFSTAPAPPSISSLSVSDLAGQSMTLQGLVNPNGGITEVHFEYNKTGSPVTLFTPTNLLSAGFTSVPVSAALNQLQPNTCYNWRIVASNAGGTATSDSSPQTSCTTPLAPLASTLSVSNLGATTATLTGRVQPNGLLTTAYFQYGTTPALLQSGAPANINGVASNAPITLTLTNLLPSTLYYCRAVAINSLGTSYGSQSAFTTRQTPPPPISTQPSNSIAITVNHTRAARAVANVVNGNLTVQLIDGGLGYPNPPPVTLSIVSGSGNVGTVIANVSGDGTVSSLTIQNPGTYSTNAQVNISIALPPNPLQQTLANTTYTTILLPAGSFDANTIITRDVTIRGQGMNLTRIDGGGRTNVFRVLPGVKATFENLTITGGSASNGGGIENQAGSIVVTSCCISNNQAVGVGGEGGGIYNRGPSSCVINSSIICNNTAKRDGGGISNSGLNTTVLPGVVNGLNTTSNAFRTMYGIVQNPSRFGVLVSSGIYSLPDISLKIAMDLNPGVSLFSDFIDKVQNINLDFESPLDLAMAYFINISGARVIKNHFGDSYGQQWYTIGGAMLIIDQSRISNNTVETEVAGFGGGIHNDLGLVLLNNSEVSTNRVTSNLGSFGGGIDNFIGAMRITNSVFRGNSVASRTVVTGGGAIFTAGGLLDVRDADLSQNSCQALFLSRGGAIKNVAAGEVNLTRCTLNQNSSGGGGAIENTLLASLFATNCTFASNTISGILTANGGGIANEKGGRITLVGCTLNHNVATGFANGGGIYNHIQFSDWSDGEESPELEQIKQQLQIITNSTAILINCTLSSNRVVGADFNIPNPSSLQQCLLQNLVNPGSCSIGNLPSFTLHLPAQGGAIYNGGESAVPVLAGPTGVNLPALAELNLSACTIYGNSASGQTLVDIPGLTVETDGGGIYNTDSAGYNNTEFARANVTFANALLGLNQLNGTASDFENSVAAPSGLGFNTTVITSLGVNLDTDGSLASAKNAGSGPVLTQSLPLLGPLAANGGPTRTHSLLVGSAALNSANPAAPNSGAGSVPLTDQRGISRPQTGRADIGAFEAAIPQTSPEAYTCLQDLPLVVAATNGVLANDIGAGLIASLSQPAAHGSATLNPDGSFIYQPATNYVGLDSFSYYAVDGAGLSNGPVLVGISVVPVLHLASNSPPRNTITGERDQLSFTFDVGLVPSLASNGIVVRGAQSVGRSSDFYLSNNVVTITPAANFHAGELVTVELLKSLLGTNGALSPVARTYQYFTKVESGSGNFSSHTTFAINQSCVAVALSDLDGNGTIDAYVAEKGSQDSVWLNDGHGNFTEIQSLPGNSTGVALGDLNGDGYPDAVVTKNGGLKNPITPIGLDFVQDYNRVYFNDGTGHFTENGQQLVTGVIYDPDLAFFLSRQYLVNIGSSGVALADLNGDGALDIFLLGNTTLTVLENKLSTPGNSVWLNNGHGSFSRTPQTISTSGSYGVALSDLNGDGSVDALVAGSYGVEKWLNDGNGIFTRVADYQSGNNNPVCIALGDLNGDGSPDFVTGNLRQYYASVGPLYGLEVWLNDGHGNFGASQFFGNMQAKSLALGDLNNDGKLDIFCSGIFGNEVWFNTGGSFVSAGAAFGTENISQGNALGDLDGDGDLDAFVANWDSLHVIGLPSYNAQIWFNNSRPVVNNFSFTVNQDGRLEIPPLGALAGVSDVDGPALILQTNTTRIYYAPTLGSLIGIVRTFPDFNTANFLDNNHYARTVPVFATNGLLNLRGDGSFTYAPNPSFYGLDGFSFVVSDGYLTATGNVNITVTQVIRPPALTNDFYDLVGGTVSVNAANGVLANDVGLNSAPLSATVAQGPAHGVLVLNPDGSFTYTANPGYTGTDSFLYRGSDGFTNSVAKVKLGNTPPLVRDDYYPMPSDGVINVSGLAGVLVNDTDPDSDSLTAQLLVAPAHGTLTMNASGSFNYQRAAGYSGNDHFTYGANDSVTTVPAVVRLGNATPVTINDGPYTVIVGQSVAISSSQGVLANDTSPDGYTLQAKLVSGPTHGALTFNFDGSFTYVPQVEFIGADAFTYTADDGVMTGAVAQVTLAVSSPDLNIVAVSPKSMAASNAPITITFNNPVSPTLQNAVVMISGSLSGNHLWTGAASNNVITITPQKGFAPGETINVTVKAGLQGAGNTALAAGYSWRFYAAAPRGSGSFPSSSVLDPVSHLSSDVCAGDFNEDGRLDAVVCSGTGDSGFQAYFNGGGRSFTNVFLVNSGDHYLTAISGDFNADGHLDLYVRRTYYDFGSSSQPPKSEFWSNDGSANFTIHPIPAVPYEWIDHIDYYYAAGDFNRDGTLDILGYAVTVATQDDASPQAVIWLWTNDGTGNFTVGPATPTHVPGRMKMGSVADVNGDGSLDLWLTGDGGSQLWTNTGTGQFVQDTSLLNSPSHNNTAVTLGDLNGDGSPDALLYNLTPAGFVVFLNDGKGKFSLGNPQPTPSLFGITDTVLGDLTAHGRLDAVLGLSGGACSILFNNGSAGFTLQTVGGNANNSAGLTLADFDGDGALDLFSSKGSGRNAILWNNRLPVARDDFYLAGTLSVAASGVLSNDFSGDGGTMTATSLVQPTNATVVLAADGYFTITPGSGFSGVTAFSYRASDSRGASDIARVKIGNTPPVAVADGSYALFNDQPLQMNAAAGVLTNDYDADGDSLSAVLSSAPLHGTLALKADGSFTYTANANYIGVDSFSYFVTDGFTNSLPALVSLNVGVKLQLVQKSPSANALNVTPGTVITAQFNGDLNPATLAGQVFVNGSQSGKISSAVNLSNNVISILPSGFRPGETITVVLGGGLQGVGGEHLSHPLTWQFTTDASLGRGIFTDSGQNLVVAKSSNSVAVALGDVNNDGSLDAVVAQSAIFSNAVVVPGSMATMVWLNNGKAAFSDSGQRLNTGATVGAASVALADVNGDGSLDIAVVRNSSPVEIWSNNGTGQFQLAPNQPPAANCNVVSFADVNGDGAPDLICLQTSSSILVLTNNGTGIFIDSGQALLNGTLPTAFAIGDVNNDNSLDIVEGYLSSPTILGSIRIWLNDGLGRFTDSGQLISTSGNSVGRMTLGDFNGDGFLDFVVHGSGVAAFWTNNGQAAFTYTGQSFAASVRGFVPADLDGNGTLDLFTPMVSAFATVRLNNPSGVLFNNSFPLGNASDIYTVAGAADLNGDGSPDLYLTGNFRPSQVFTNTAGLGSIAGLTALNINDTAGVAPFSNILLSGLSNSTVTVSVTLNSLAGGTFTSSSLTAAGFTGPVGSTYSRSIVAITNAQAALRQLVFAPVPNRKPVGQTEATTFTVIVSSGSVSRTNSTAIVNALSLNDPPIATNDSGLGFSTTELLAFNTFNVLTNDSDIDPGDRTNLTVASFNTASTIGLVTNLGNGSFRYDPNGRFSGLPLGSIAEDSFTYIATDGHQGYSTGKVTIAISGLNNPPVANADAISLNEHAGVTALTPLLLANDSDPDVGQTTSLNITGINTAGTHGAALLTTGTVTYNPNSAFTNLAQGATLTDQFTYTIQDALGSSATAPVTITIIGENDSPVAVADFLTLAADANATNLTTLVLTNDADADPGETASLVINGLDLAKTLGVASLTNGILTYRPGSQFLSLPAGSNALDTINYVIQDIHGASAQATVTITNIGVNQPPVPGADVFQVRQGQVATNITSLLLANDTDPNTGETATLNISSIKTNGTTGTATFTGGNVLYSPNPTLQLGPSQSVTDSFSYVLSDIHGTTATGLVSVVITGINLAPSARADLIIVGASEGPVNLTSRLLANDINPNAGYASVLSISSISTSGTRGQVSLADGMVWYDARNRFTQLSPGQLTTDGFSYTVNEPFGASAIASVGIVIVKEPVIVTAKVQTNATFHVRLLGVPNVACSVLVSTNLTAWSNAGSATETSPGIFDFDAPLAAHPPIWYRGQQSLSGLDPAVIPPTIVNSARDQTRQFNLSISGLAANYTVFASSNLVQWFPVGAATLAGPGRFEFTDTTATNQPMRFYRARTP